MADGNPTTTIIVALIGTAGIVAAAWITHLGNAPAAAPAAPVATSASPAGPPPNSGGAASNSAEVLAATNTQAGAASTSQARPATARPIVSRPAAQQTQTADQQNGKGEGPALPTFAGEWVAEDGASAPVSITQSGGSLTIELSGRRGQQTAQIGKGGTAIQQDSFADDGAGHANRVSAELADTIITNRWRISGQELTRTNVVDVRRPSSLGSAVGVHTVTTVYRRAG
jgi:hypothetical protein